MVEEVGMAHLVDEVEVAVLLHFSHKASHHGDVSRSSTRVICHGGRRGCVSKMYCKRTTRLRYGVGIRLTLEMMIKSSRLYVEDLTVQILVEGEHFIHQGVACRTTAVAIVPSPPARTSS